ncbi:5'(3')-deoxyribonucleotidase [Corchorus capsularis]|uniref:5'(3')-deoxyribonucleotidase n=1 Tax=Corchorus capsularis TaxID=210143 RepID=A0A1R3H9P9_COCAP|nr:5'(3')-deoxyribonucleotidase [Corchorus capsularis]
MLKKQSSSVRFFFNQFYFSGFNRCGKDRFMAFLARNDPFLKQFHTLPNDHRRCHPFPGKLDSLENHNVGAGFKFQKPASGLNLTLKSCFEDSLKTWDHKARAFAPQLARDLEIISHKEPQKLAKPATDTRGACQRGNPLDFSDKPLPEKISVAVDVDEVLGNFVSALNRFIADRYSSNHSVSEYHVYEFFKIWNCSRDEADIRVHEFFKTPYFKKGIHPLPGAQRALHRLSRICNLSVVTSRQNVIKDHTIDWLEKHYPGLFQEIHFGNHFALDGESRPKSEICRFLGAKILIDDNPRYAIECAQVGIRVLLFDYENSYPWSKMETIDQHPLVTKVHNWEEAEQQIVSWILSSTIP